MSRYQHTFQRSIEHPESFWAEQAKRIPWYTPPQTILSYDEQNSAQSPSQKHARWFSDGEMNLSYAALDYHVEYGRGDQAAIFWDSPAAQAKQIISYREMRDKVAYFAGALTQLGVTKGDRVVIYMPMIPEALVAMYACARLGAIHSVVFGGFAPHELAARIEDAEPKVVVAASCGIELGKVLPYKPMVDQAVELSAHKPDACVVYQREAHRAELGAGDHDWEALVAKAPFAECVPVKGTDPLYILYTSGTTGKPKGVMRDTGGYAVALAASMKHIYCSNPGEAYFSTSDIGWVVGHSYIVYGPLINGSTTIMYEGLPIRPDPAIWWKIVADYKVTSMFSSPTAIRVLKKQDPAYMSKYDVKCLKYLFLAGEPLDEPTARWVADNLGCPVVDNYWQTETGWPILSACLGVEDTPRKFGSPSFPVYGYNVKLKDEVTGKETGPDEKGVLCVVPPLPPGAMTTVWGDDERYVKTYYGTFRDEMVYSTFDWAVRDKDGYYFVLGRTDDVINVAGHRLGTREIEEAVQAHAGIAEVAVVGVADSLKGQVPVAFAVAKDASKAATKELAAALEKEVMATVDRELGAIGRPARVHFVTVLPKTRSGKLLRRSIQALCEGRDPGDLTTIEDPGALEQIRAALRG